MPKRKELPREDQTFTCSNSACGLVFSKPIKVINLRAADTEPYDACPRCFAELVVESKSAADKKQEVDVEVTEVEIKPESHGKKVEEEPTVKCAHHFGYLSERSRNEKIPDECVTCEHIVDCMLKGMSK